MEKINHFRLNEQLALGRGGMEDDEDEDCKVQVKSVMGKECSRVSGKAVENCIKLFQTFQSFSQVTQAINMYEARNKVNLAQKYYRRIAANPKPSNKEDFMLSEEERKRFVYRWVDFCCTYFDDLLIARANQDDEDGSGTTQVQGFAMKECPMRIRFQLRFNEKDLMVSILREEHDHNHPNIEVPQLPTLPKALNTAPANNTVDHRNVKRHKPPPPSLAPIEPPSKFSKLASSGLHSDFISLPSGGLRRSQIANSSLPIPKPPPLKAMPLLCTTDSANPTTSNGCTQGSSVEDIIRNIYHYLCRMQTGGCNSQNGLRFTSSHPDLIKITSELSGVDKERVLQFCQTNRPRNAKTTLTSQTSGASRPSIPTRKANAMQSGECLEPFSNYKFSDARARVPAFNTEPEFCNPSLEDTEEPRFVNMPVEVIIKAEPEDTVDYYDENDSNSSTSMNNEYFGHDQDETPR